MSQQKQKDPEVSVRVCFYHLCLATLQSSKGFQFWSKTSLLQGVRCIPCWVYSLCILPWPTLPHWPGCDYCPLTSIGLGVTIALSPALAWVWLFPSHQHWPGCGYCPLTSIGLGVTITLFINIGMGVSTALSPAVMLSVLKQLWNLLSHGFSLELVQSREPTDVANITSHTFSPLWSNFPLCPYT